MSLTYAYNTSEDRLAGRTPHSFLLSLKQQVFSLVLLLRCSLSVMPSNVVGGLTGYRESL